MIYTRLPGGSPCIKMVIYTAALQHSQPNRLYTRLLCVYIKSLFTRQPFKSQLGYIYTATGCIYMKLLFTRQPFKSQLGYIHGCRVYIHEIVIYTAAIQEPTRLYTLAEDIYTAAGWESMYLKWLFTWQPFKTLSQIGYIHSCRVSTKKSLFTRQPFKSQLGYIYTATGCIYMKL